MKKSERKTREQMHNDQWEENFRLAEDYYREHGGLLVPYGFISEGKRLGRWIGTQRGDYQKRKNPMFTEERFERLNRIGMVWDVDGEHWEFMYQLLSLYRKENGTARVPQSYVSGKEKLGLWVNKQRIDYHLKVLKPERVKRLEELDMIWNAEALRRQQWDFNLKAVKCYAKSHGGALPPASYTKGECKLGRWLAMQRVLARKGRLLPERAEKLRELNPDWLGKEEEQGREQSFEWNYEKAEQYVYKNGNLGCFSGHEGEVGEELHKWLSIQRAYYRRDKLSEMQIQKLEALGMIWDVREAQWERMYRGAEAFYIKHGNLRVSKGKGEPEERRLGEWVGSQRRDYKERTNPFFTDERIRRLEAVGMIWNALVTPEEYWERWYQKAEEFYGLYGHLSPAKGQLRTWLLAQRSARRGKRGSISDSQIERLNAVGMVWEPMEEQWMRMYSLAKEYYAVHQKLNIPSTYAAAGGELLGNWITAQRSGYKNFRNGIHGGGRNVITEEHAELLNQIEMIWDASAVTSSTSFQEQAVQFYLKPFFPDAGKMSRFEELGYELDIYLPSRRTAIEYDGIWHREMRESDEKKGRACLESGIELIRLREPGLPKVYECGCVIELEGTGDSQLGDGIRRLLDYLGVPSHGCDIGRDKNKIRETYRDYVSRRWDQMYEEVLKICGKRGKLEFGREEKSRNGIKLQDWIYTQREAYKNDELTEDQAGKLNRLGMQWEPFEKRWEGRHHGKMSMAA